MSERRAQVVRVVTLMLVCLGLAIAGGAPSDNHISQVGAGQGQEAGWTTWWLQ